MEKDILKKIEEQDQKIDEINNNVKKIKKVLFWKFIITLIVVILPIIGISIAIPKFLEALTNTTTLGL
ncbi:MAG: hypothetical protein K9M12_01365 [Candidatus Pacebacteria bacterium]|nr:hypothetical protein [Candidatus Paceibacterota bacterium]